ncbi:hypothetical protein H6P81_015493 [Aristolochia fimbriata]|uniref:E3 ubiquitin-protein ligase RNF170 n=1 Tax=Aristolochia fimbriata TaxID=158543 RepID=A0AAV7EAB5_ARIFI|nr:hypothetical protein H6P81_015493 [Aristolochia fimbriata]
MVPPPDDVCPICHDRFALASACQANCSHWFCAHCIIRVWQHGSTLQPCKCPICRRQITLLIPSDSRVHHNDSEAGRALEMIEKYNRLFGGGSYSLLQRVQDLPFLIRRLLGELLNPQRSLPLVLRVRAVLAMLLSAAYVISPVDIIPEALFGIVGLMDDLLIVLVVFLHLSALYRSALVYRHGGT